MTRYDVVMLRRGDPGDSPSPVTIHGLPVWARLSERLEAEGHRLVVGPDRAQGDRPIVILWDFGSVARAPSDVLARAQGRVVAWCLESPLVAHRGFHRLDAIARDSASVLTFPGARPLLDDGLAERFRAISYPISGISREPRTPSSGQRFLTMINSNKTVTGGPGSWDLTRLMRSARRLAASTLARSYALRGSWTLPDLYRERAHALEHFSSRSDFDLYGRDWDRPIPGLSRAKHEQVRARYRGIADSKEDVLNAHRFCLCFENTSFPGYITEKIFDCFLAGTIPVYLGAPDIEEYIPSEAFVDTRRFQSYGVLEHYLREMSPAKAKGYLEAAEGFVRSPMSRRFGDEEFVESILSAALAWDP